MRKFVHVLLLILGFLIGGVGIIVGFVGNFLERGWYTGWKLAENFIDQMEARSSR